MAYELSWYIPNRILYLSILGDYALDDARLVNRNIIEELENSPHDLMLFIDGMEMKRLHNFQEIRSSQEYMDHPKLKRIFVATNDRLVKLAMMVIFNLSHAYLTIFDDVEKADVTIQRQFSDFDRSSN